MTTTLQLTIESAARIYYRNVRPRLRGIKFGEIVHDSRNIEIVRRRRFGILTRVSRHFQVSDGTLFTKPGIYFHLDGGNWRIFPFPKAGRK